MDLKAHAFEGFPEDRGHARPPAHSLDIKSFCQSENHCVPNEINSKVPPPPKKKCVPILLFVSRSEQFSKLFGKACVQASVCAGSMGISMGQYVLSITYFVNVLKTSSQQCCSAF